MIFLQVLITDEIGIIYLKNTVQHIEILTLYSAMHDFNDFIEEDFCKHTGKRRKRWSPALSAFPTMLSDFLKPVSIFHSFVFCHLQNSVNNFCLFSKRIMTPLNQLINQ